MAGNQESKNKIKNVATLHFEISQSINNSLNIPEVELHKLFLNTFSVGVFYCFVYYLQDQKVEFCSSGVEKLLGIRTDEFGLEYMRNKMHPDDVDGYVRNETALFHILQTLKPEKLIKYKARQDFRLKNKSGIYKRILHQVLILQNDSEGNIMRTYGISTDISAYKMEGEMRVDLIGLDGEPSFYDIKPDGSFSNGFQILTEREHSVLNQISLGKTSKEIAAELNISENTVKNHRRNILVKTKASSTTELIQIGLDQGWL